ncbi:uncharacterized protein BP01DRAFT_182866 [Aspergillus saccharolyticus JOP 1030-1]|uniref:Uncharacterized protein n=1 Tax=Aspergillus saccharolyticus JOP 1030-1 TaxID=1450539 RepID=A0A318Z2E9_9EURO|nr:hypothetical protein BP01DRAFT_182866 [Aspergillus saccharolyticus JOP 1030-1]PYH41226.1 hypothetical protein BP01DRAFT_182866 [Aspergillus saccharolyticus JOP 1030-1]
MSLTSSKNRLNHISRRKVNPQVIVSCQGTTEPPTSTLTRRPKIVKSSRLKFDDVHGLLITNPPPPPRGSLVDLAQTGELRISTRNLLCPADRSYRQHQAGEIRLNASLDPFAIVNICRGVFKELKDRKRRRK